MSTINLYYRILGQIANGAEIKMGSLSNPVTITAASSVGSDTTYLVPTATVFTLTDDLDATTNLVAILSPVDATLVWTTTTDADNSSCGIKANVPFLMANLYTSAYDAISSTRTSNALTSVISVLKIYQSSGSTQKIRVVTFD